MSAVGAVLACACVVPALVGCEGGPAVAPEGAGAGAVSEASRPIPAERPRPGVRVEGSDSPGQEADHRRGTEVRVITGDDELGISDEGEWLALLPYSRGERGEAVHVGSVDAGAMFQPGSLLGEAVVPAQADTVGVALLPCPAQGCEEEIMRAEAERPAVVGTCVVDVQVAPGTVIDVAVDRPKLGSPSCRVAWSIPGGGPGGDGGFTLPTWDSPGPGEPGEAAELRGILRIEDGCAWVLSDRETVAVLWPREFSGSSDPPALLDAEGEVVARPGQEIVGSGGQHEIDIGRCGAGERSVFRANDVSPGR